MELSPFRLGQKMLVSSFKTVTACLLRSPMCKISVQSFVYERIMLVVGKVDPKSLQCVTRLGNAADSSRT